MMNLLRAFFAVLPLLVWITPLIGDENQGDGSIRFMARAFGDDYFEGIRFYNADGHLTLLEFDPFSRTAIHHLPEGASEAVFVRTFLDNRGREQETTVAVADIEAIESRAFLVFFARRDHVRDLPYTVYVADESPGMFEAGHLRFLNLSHSPLLARLGEETFSFEYGFSENVAFDPNNIEEVPLKFALRVEDEWKIVYSSGIRSHPKVGTLAILKPPRRSDSLQIQVELRQRRYYFDKTEETTE